jgi:3-oxocholest-4-en-26-oyl-CoA dehydrogenase beta subunit
VAPAGVPAGAWATQRMLVMTCAVQVGLMAGALDMTAAYTTQRQQFGGPLASLQAVQHRLADCWIDTEAVRWTTWEAVSALEQRDLAELAVEVATYWSSEAAPRVMSALAHLHGGTGVDTSYPLHRYFLASRHLELVGGGAGAHLARLGAMLAGGGGTP